MALGFGVTTFQPSFLGHFVRGLIRRDLRHLDLCVCSYFAPDFHLLIRHLLRLRVPLYRLIYFSSVRRFLPLGHATLLPLLHFSKFFLLLPLLRRRLHGLLLILRHRATSRACLPACRQEGKA